MPKQKNKFKGYTYEEKKALQEKIADAREQLRLLHNRVTNSDIDTDLVYNELFSIVESLYVPLKINELAQDHQASWNREKERVRKAHGN